MMLIYITTWEIPSQIPMSSAHSFWQFTYWTSFLVLKEQSYCSGKKSLVQKCEPKSMSHKHFVSNPVLSLTLSVALDKSLKT